MVDRFIMAVAPGYAAKRERAKTEIVRHQAVQRVLNQGYGDHGASRRKKSLQYWNPAAGDADEDIHQNLEELRPRARDLYMGGALPNGSLKTLRTNIVGTGLRLKPAFDADFLRLSDEQADRLRSQIEREFSLWANSKDCDATGLHDFYELQQLAFLSQMMSGDVFALLPVLPRPNAIYDTRIKLLEADRCSTPNSQEGLSGNKIQSGVEVDQDGMIVAYWFSDRHPGSIYGTPLKWNRVQVVGPESGRRNVLHLMEAERPEQRRGVPILAPVIESLKQLERYTEAELTAAVISAMFTVFIETESPDQDQFSLPPVDGPIENATGEPVPPTDDELRLGAGAVQFLQPGEKVTIANPGRPNAGFDPFVSAILRQVGASLEIPYELLLKNFTASYSASRAALIEAWKMFRMRRAWMAADFCQPIYEEWFAEAAIKGRIDAPGIFDDPALFKAYTKAEWHGPSQGQLDPVKEVNAAVLRVKHGFSTRQREAAELTGSEFETNIRQLAYEQKIREQYGLKEGGTSYIEEGGEEKDAEENQT